jgi:hypothetical protein
MNDVSRDLGWDEAMRQDRWDTAVGDVVFLGTGLAMGLLWVANCLPPLLYLARRAPGRAAVDRCDDL